MKIGLPGEPNSIRCAQDYPAFVKSEGLGQNQLRTDRFAQPGALEYGDILATGYAVVGEPRIGYNSTTLVCMTKGVHDARWIDIPPRLPLAFLREDQKLEAEERASSLPEDLRQGDILANGDEVLAPPIWCVDEKVLVTLTGGSNGHVIQVPDNIPIALLIESDNAPKEIREHAQRWRDKVGRSAKQTSHQV